MNNRILLSVALLSGLLLGGRQLSASPAYGRDAAVVPGVSSAQTVQAGTEKAQTFTGQIAQQDGKYVLLDKDSGAGYQLDDQEKAKQFDGQKVKVKGTLDQATMTIHVSDIQPA